MGIISSRPTNHLYTTRIMYWPDKYHRGLTRKANAQRKRSATRRARMSWKDPKAYTPFRSDKNIRPRKSSYTARWHKTYPGASSLASASRTTGVPRSILETSFNRGMAAWRTGHRPGASQQAWGYARVYSLLQCGKTARTTDADLVRQARRTRKGRKWFASCSSK